MCWCVFQAVGVARGRVGVCVCARPGAGVLTPNNHDSEHRNEEQRCEYAKEKHDNVLCVVWSAACSVCACVGVGAVGVDGCVGVWACGCRVCGYGCGCFLCVFFFFFFLFFLFQVFIF